MRYAVLGGGKRIRPVLVYSAGEAVGAASSARRPGGAVELIHAYSLVHDDLPAWTMTTCGTASPPVTRRLTRPLAMLVGRCLANAGVSDARQDCHDGSRRRPSAGECWGCWRRLPVRAAWRAVRRSIWRRSAGTDPGRTGIHAHPQDRRPDSRQRAAGCAQRPELEPAILERLDRYAKCIGLAFQIRDDILDVIGDTATLGKTAGADRALDKPTYPALLGLDAAREHARSLHEAALSAWNNWDRRPNAALDRRFYRRSGPPKARASPRRPLGIRWPPSSTPSPYR